MNNSVFAQQYGTSFDLKTAPASNEYIATNYIRLLPADDGGIGFHFKATDSSSFIASTGNSTQKCFQAVDITTVKDTSYFVNSNIAWVKVIPTNDTSLIIFGVSDSATLTGNVYMYTGTCDSLTLINTYSFNNDSVMGAYLTNLDTTTYYYFKVEFNNVLKSLFKPGIFTKQPSPDPCPPFNTSNITYCPHPCNLIVNGKFECVCPDIFFHGDARPSPPFLPFGGNDYDPFHFGRVLGWRCGWGTPNIHTTSEYNNCAYMWNSNTSGGEGIYQDITNIINNGAGFDYKLTFMYNNPSDVQSNLHIWLANFQDNPSGPGTDGSGTTFDLGSINLINISNIPVTLPNTHWFTGQVNNIPITSSSPPKLTFFPFITGTNDNLVRRIEIDNVVLTPYIKITGPTTFCYGNGNSLTLTASLPPLIGAVNYNWYISGNLNPIASSTSTLTVSPSVNTTYTVIGTDANGCQYTKAFSVIVLEAPQKPIITGNITDCEAEDIYTITNYDANNDYTWTVTNNIYQTTNPTATDDITWNTTLITNVNPGIITVKVTNHHGDCPVSTTFNVYQCCCKDGHFMSKDSLFEKNATNLCYNNETFNQGNPIPSPFPGEKIYFNGITNINYTTTISFPIEMGPMAQIVVGPNCTLTVDKGTLHAGCDFMWDGVYMTDPAPVVTVKNGTIIEDAVNGLVSNNGEVINIEDSYMTNNYYNVKFSNSTTTTYSGYIKNTSFTGTTNLPYLPYLGEKTLVGIYCKNVNNLTIGENSTSNNFNTMQYGIYSINSNLNVYNNQFDNISDGLPILNGPPQYGDGAIYAISWNGSSSSYSLTVGSTSLSNHFNNCNTGIQSINYTNSLVGNIFIGCEKGISLLKTYNSEVKFNIIKQLNNNTTFKTPPGISIKNTYNPINFCNLNIYDNSIINNGTGIYLINNSFSNVESNTIRSYFTSIPSNFTGININNGFDLKVLNNGILRVNSSCFNTTSSYNNINGVYIHNTEFSTILLNSIIQMYNGIYTNGSLFGTQFGCNYLENNYYGIQFGSGSNISNQGEEYVFNPANSWLDGYNIINPYCSAYLNGTLAHQFNYYYWNTTELPIYYSPSLFQIFQPPTQNSTSFNFCTTPLGFSIFPTTPAERETAIGQIVRNQMVYDTLQAVNLAMARESVYKTLLSDSILIYMGDTSDYVYNAFFNTMQSSDAAHYINAINAMDTNNLTIAQRELNLIADTNAINHNRIIVGNIYSTTWALGNYQLTDDQVRTLTDIAYSDPYTNGDGVYTARVMLNIDPDDSNLVYRMALQLPKQVVKSNSVHVYPNPAKEMITIAFDEPISNDGIIEIWSIMGKKLLATTIPKATKQQKVNISSLTSGIYFYVIKVNNNKLTSDKLIILNK